MCTRVSITRSRTPPIEEEGGEEEEEEEEEEENSCVLRDGGNDDDDDDDDDAFGDDASQTSVVRVKGLEMLKPRVRSMCLSRVTTSYVLLIVSIIIDAKIQIF